MGWRMSLAGLWDSGTVGLWELQEVSGRSFVSSGNSLGEASETLAALVSPETAERSRKQLLQNLSAKTQKLH